MKFPGLRKTHFTCLKLQLNKFYSVSQSSARIFKKNLFRFLFCFLLCMFLFHNQPFFATSCFLIKIKKNKKQMLNCKIETKYHFKINKTRVQFWEYIKPKKSWNYKVSVVIDFFCIKHVSFFIFRMAASLVRLRERSHLLLRQRGRCWQRKQRIHQDVRMWH